LIRCSICHTRVADTDPKEDCPDCQQSYHAGCWTELGGCATYGCKSTPAAEKPAPIANAGGGWGDSKDCPSCAISIGASKLVCACGARFPYADPMTGPEYTLWKEGQAGVKGSKRILTALFIGSIIGVTAPLCGLLSGIFGYKKREQLAGEHGTFLALACGSAALGLVYSLVIVAMALDL
jgi:hypothetical protein